METMNILITVDAKYLRHVKTMLVSLRLNGGPGIFDVYLVHADINDTPMADMDEFCQRLGMNLIPVRLHEDDFADAPVTAYYSKAMYYRLLASKILPESLDKVLYIDPDTLIINPVAGLYGIDMGTRLFAAAAHNGLTGISKHINRIRLNTPDAEGYFNSGIMLLNLEKQRGKIREQDIFDYVRAKGKELILPDQDVLNALYSNTILPLDDSLYNYDSRRFEAYFLASGGLKDMDWVMQNTVIIHYCGGKKPWHHGASGRFVTLYKHYEQVAERFANSTAKVHLPVL